MSPDGSRTVKASVPAGLKSGDSFLVRLAKPEQLLPPSDAQPNFADALDNWLSPKPQSAVVTPSHGRSDNSLTEAVSPHMHMPSKSSPHKVAGQPVRANVEKAEMRQENPASAPNSGQSNQKLMMVNVPPGMPAGSSLQVEIPGENRTIMAQVPPGGVKSFHVAYTPRSSHTRARAPPPQANSTLVPRHNSPKGQKLLLVRVPPGTPPGTTLHVSVPDEPGRILAAQVPPGNVQEFHVSYESRPPQPQQAGMLPPANAYRNASYHSNNYHSSPQQQRTNNNGAEGYMMPVVTGAAFGAAGAATYDHFAHNTTGGGDYAQDGGYGDVGGGDDGFGGGFDF